MNIDEFKKWGSEYIHSQEFDDLSLAAAQEALEVINRKADLISRGYQTIHLTFYVSAVTYFLDHFQETMKDIPLGSFSEYLREMADKFEGKNK